MEMLWTWGGRFFGYQEGHSLYTHFGKHVGAFQEKTVYSIQGQYLGELMNGRLITHPGKKSWRSGLVPQHADRVGIVPHVNYVGYVMIAGYEDFPDPEMFRHR